ncbi:MAG: hypothetical protein Q6354_03345 [Candidatus Brocadiales bacterium]|nr:hypothetical protein [Candidatus Brocadiales bacterium]
MMGLLVEREVLPNLQARLSLQPHLSITQAQLKRPLRMGIFLLSQKIGLAEWLVQEEPDGMLKIINSTKIDGSGILSVQNPIRAKFDLITRLAPGGRLDSFRLEMDSPLATGLFTGNVVDDKLYLQTKIDKQTPSVKIIPFNPRMLGSTGLFPFYSFPRLSVGSSWNWEVFNPFTQRVEAITVKVKGVETYNKKDKVFVVGISYGRHEMEALVDKWGQVLRQEFPFGFVLVREEGDD